MRKTYEIWRRVKLKLDTFAQTNSIFKELMIEWDERKTRIISATLSGTFHIAQDRNSLKTYMNDYLIWDEPWDIGQGCSTRRKSDSVEVINGLNTFLIELHRFHFWVGEVVSTISLYLHIEFEGEEPKVEPKWMRYLLPALGITLGVTSVGIGAYTVKKREEKK